MSANIQKILEDDYQIGAIQDVTRLKSGVSNENYKAVTDIGQYVARICHFEPQNQINVMIPFLEYAETVDYPAPRLVKTKTGDTFIGPATEPVIVTTLVEGEAGTYEDIGDGKLVSLGANLARLHAIDWQPEEPSKTANTTYILGVYTQFMPEVATSENTNELLEILAEDYGRFVTNNIQAMFTSLPRGLIHNDVIPGNVLFQNDSVTSFVDLEEVSQGIMLLDIARVLNSWCFVDNQPVGARFSAFLKSYNDHRTLTLTEVQALPVAMHFIAFRNSVYGLKMLAQKRIQGVSYNGEFENLKFVRSNQHQVAELISSSL